MKKPIQARKSIPGFSVWFDRWKGRGWCWREKASSKRVLDPETDVRYGEGYSGEREACEAICAEIRRRDALRPPPAAEVVELSPCLDSNSSSSLPRAAN